MKDKMLRFTNLIILQMLSSGLTSQENTHPATTNVTENVTAETPASPNNFEKGCIAYRLYAANHTNKRLAFERIMTSQEACQVVYFCQLETKIDGFCPSIIDALGTCFPQSASGEKVSVACLAQLNGVQYNTSDTVTRKCLEGGRWENRSQYSCRAILDEIVCKDIVEFVKTYGFTPKEKQPCEVHFSNVIKISLSGRGISLCSLMIAFVVFCSIRSQWIYRTGSLYIIHWNFVISLILRNILWICLYVFMGSDNNTRNTVLCPGLVTIFNYSQTTSYCWMFLEGIYLHRYVAVQIFNDDKLSWRFYVTVGWGVPVLIISAWAGAKSFLDNGTCWLPGQNTSSADYIFKVPVLLALLINFVIMVNVIRILISKLCNPPDRRTRDFFVERTHYFKTAKAALVLFPLLGLTYILFLISPGYGTKGETAFLYINTILDSFQGFFVCVIYYYAHHDIQVVMAKKMKQMRSWMIRPCAKEDDTEMNSRRRTSNFEQSSVRQTADGNASTATANIESEDLLNKSNYCTRL